jgi:hypothetical protein
LAADGDDVLFNTKNTKRHEAHQVWAILAVLVTLAILVFFVSSPDESPAPFVTFVLFVDHPSDVDAAATSHGNAAAFPVVTQGVLVRKAGPRPVRRLRHVRHRL